MSHNISLVQNSRCEFVLLAPEGARIPHAFQAIRADRTRHEQLLREMQALRGRIYLEDGAIQPEHLDEEGCHNMPGDRESWHLLRLRNDGSVSGCTRILVHPKSVTFDRLRLASAAIAWCAEWANHLQKAVESEIEHARRSALTLIEPGGWALAEDLRGGPDGLMLAIASFAWSQIAGGCLGFLTATVRHGSSSILRRLGGAPLHADGNTLPKYYDPGYGCDMELLRFDSRSLNPRFEPLLEKARAMLAGAPVILAEPAAQKFARAAA